eukprot:TRINITY_DN6817_c0_g1_i1.p1 TRINITY_DN6817_c0_g1~~TRINITY_DN6817_c0_g1_i1.p1  ORF type:complete len:539 (-),score=74.46 TRINITY_DN6817_c0_g1_i1:20-1636(-)
MTVPDRDAWSLASRTKFRDLPVVLRSLSQKPNHFEVHAKGVLKWLQRRAQRSRLYCPPVAPRRDTVSSCSSSLTAGEPEVREGGATAQTHFLRGITCDAPMRSDEHLTREVPQSISSPAPLIAREKLFSPSSRCLSECSTVLELGFSAASSSSCGDSTAAANTTPGLQSSSSNSSGNSRLVRGHRQRSLGHLQDLCLNHSAVGFNGHKVDLPWPQDVLELLERRVPGKSCIPPRDPKASPTRLRFASGAFAMPHPEKASSTGADSHFLGDGFSLGVADGVGEWQWRFGIDARAFADELMTGCEAHLVGHLAENISARQPTQWAQEALAQGYRTTKSFGSSTAIVAALQRSGQLGVANVGDSALLLLRRKELDSTDSLRCVGRTREQQHTFNCPYQLSLLPTPNDFPNLIQQGKDKLVRAIQRRPLPKADCPEDADLYNFNVQEGDLVVLGTDGVFDNLYVHEICQLAGTALGPLETGDGHVTDAAQIAQAITKAAFHRSMDRSIRCPFGDHAKQAGLYHTGGKMDDITCVCAWVLNDE